MRTTFRVLATALVISLSACSDNANQQSGIKDLAASSEPHVLRPEIEASVKNRKEFQEHIKSHAGKVVVVDLWALW